MDYTQILTDINSNINNIMSSNTELIEQVKFNNYLMLFVAGLIIGVSIVFILKGID